MRTNPIPLLLMTGTLALASADLLAGEHFRIDDIRVEGLERIKAGTVFTYLPLKVGSRFDFDQSPEIIRTLFQTGFFKDVQLYREGDVLVVKVAERPAIADIKIEGNKDLETDQLMQALKGVGIAKGRVFNPTILERMEMELRQQYFGRGKYNVQIKTTVRHLPRNRVSIHIDISEGVAAKIHKIIVVGNHAFTDKQILSRLDSGIPAWWALFSSRDEYSKQKLAGDLEKIRSLYLDNGYIHFDIDSTQVTISPDRKDIYITINVKEGAQYKVGKVRLDGQFIVPREELEKLVQIHGGDVFSRQKLTDTTSAISKKLGAHGYAFANVNAIPDIDEKNRIVNLTFFVDPGKRVYVRRINFRGNYTTNEEVLRREMRQMEAGWYDTRRIDRSKVRLQRLPYIAEVNIETRRVPGVDDQVDLDVGVTERMSGSFTVGAGYSQSQGLSFNLGLTQDNFMGSGKRVATSVTASKSTQVFNLSYTNPYYTIDGVSRGFNFFHQNTDTTDLAITTYLINRTGLTVTYGIPLTEYDYFSTTIGPESTKVVTGTDTAQEIVDFVNREGERNTLLRWRNSYAHDTRNRTVFPESGNLQRIGVETTVPGSQINFYKLSYTGKYYHKIFGDTIFTVRGNISHAAPWGDTVEVPFYEKYYAGGINSVRGYEDNSLGPVSVSTGNAIGGNFRTTATMELVFPSPFEEEASNFRMSAFVDVGNVFADVNDFDTQQLRASVGIGAIWLSPVGPLVFSLAQPLHDQPGDRLQRFQFSVGTGI
ncbi:MAG: outer membrane protein assembly factor BamA [Gammaproteobacteria bacterium]|nr:MAG: outer membrane protein assembly factor BamA [Gammaproteobacteria bacterium]